MELVREDSAYPQRARVSARIPVCSETDLDIASLPELLMMIIKIQLPLRSPACRLSRSVQVLK